MRVLIADERYSVRMALRAVLEHDPKCGGIDEAVDAPAALAALGFGADLMIVEWGLKGLAPEEFLSQAKAARPGLVVVALGRFRGAAEAALAAGADCYIDTSEPPRDFVGLLHHLCPDVLAALEQLAPQPATEQS